jgi:hypothetical protein
MHLVNLTSHEIVLRGEGRDDFVIPSSGQVRCGMSTLDLPEVSGWPVTQVEVGDPVGLPEPKEDTAYIVSNLVLQQMRGRRHDLVAPNTMHRPFRNEHGDIVAVRGFVR